MKNFDWVKFGEHTCQLAKYFGLQLEYDIFPHQSEFTGGYLKFKNQQGFSYSLMFRYINDVSKERAAVEVVEKAVMHKFHFDLREKLNSPTVEGGLFRDKFN